MAEQKFCVFFNHIPNSNMIFPDGSIAAFTGGRFATDNPDKVAFLQSEIKNGNPHLYIKEDFLVVSADQLAPDAELRARYFAEFQAQQEAIAKGDTTYGSSEQGKLNVADTSVIAAGAADSSSGATPGITLSVGKTSTSK